MPSLNQENLPADFWWSPAPGTRNASVPASYVRMPKYDAGWLVAHWWRLTVAYRPHQQHRTCWAWRRFGFWAVWWGGTSKHPRHEICAVWMTDIASVFTGHWAIPGCYGRFVLIAMFWRVIRIRSMMALSSCKRSGMDQVLEGLRPGLHLVVFGALLQPFGFLIWVFGWGAGNHFPRLNSQTCLHRREQHLQLQKSLLKEGETFTWLAVSNMGYFPCQLGWLSQATRFFLGCVKLWLSYYQPVNFSESLECAWIIVDPLSGRFSSGDHGAGGNDTSQGIFRFWRLGPPKQKLFVGETGGFFRVPSAPSAPQLGLSCQGAATSGGEVLPICLGCGEDWIFFVHFKWLNEDKETMTSFEWFCWAPIFGNLESHCCNMPVTTHCKRCLAGCLELFGSGIWNLNHCCDKFLQY